MGKKRARVKPEEVELKEEHKTWSVSDPGMDLLERAGLAGLYMALLAANEGGIDLSPLTWRDDELKPDSVTVRWSGPAKPAFVRLMEWAWQVRDGVMYFAAVHETLDAAKWYLRVPMHSGVMRTFLQHTNVQPKGAPITRIVRLDEDKEIAITFQPPILREPKAKEVTQGETPKKPTKPKMRNTPKLLKPHKHIDELFDDEGRFSKEQVGLSNWLYPGVAGRYGKEKSDKSWQGTADRALLLMLAPSACLYQRLQGGGNNWIVVVPDVQDLAEFAIARKRVHLAPESVDIASLGDAGLNFHAHFSTRDPRQRIRAGCRVVAMGGTTFYGKKPGQRYGTQAVRKSVLDVPLHLSSVKRYRLLHLTFPNHFQHRKDDGEAVSDKPVKKGRGKKAVSRPSDEPQGNGWYKLPTGRGRIADNLVAGRPWYREVFVPLPWDEDELERLRKYLRVRDARSYSRETTWFLGICMQRSKLMRLIAEDDMWDSEAEKVFVQAFWETLDSLYAQEAAATKRGGSASVEKRWERLEGEVYRSLMQAKTLPLLRAAIAGWFARAGRPKSLASHIPAIWRLIDHAQHWRKGRDLALVALASHRKKAVREGKEPKPETDTQGE